MNDKKKFLWVYALVMFVSAFTILLMTAYSQIKYEKSASQIKFELTKKESQVKDFSVNLKSVTDKKKELEQQNKNFQHMIDGNNKKILELSAYANNTKTSYENILKAQRLYKEKNYNDACDLLLLVDENLLGEEMQKTYNSLKNSVFSKVGLGIFNQGKKHYNQQQYDLAVIDFEKLLNIDHDGKYQKSTIKYLIDCYSNLGNNQKEEYYKKMQIEKENI